MDIVELHAYISGKVQGVGFRAMTSVHAKALHLTGFVRNLSDGRVELVAQGTKENLDALLSLLKTNGGASRIDKIDSEYIQSGKKLNAFTIK